MLLSKAKRAKVGMEESSTGRSSNNRFVFRYWVIPGDEKLRPERSAGAQVKGNELQLSRTYPRITHLCIFFVPTRNPVELKMAE
jgi:hypothetical protein